jgi:hypothetical protein
MPDPWFFNVLILDVASLFYSWVVDEPCQYGFARESVHKVMLRGAKS